MHVCSVCARGNILDIPRIRGVVVSENGLFLVSDNVSNAQFGEKYESSKFAIKIDLFILLTSFCLVGDKTGLCDFYN